MQSGYRTLAKLLHTDGSAERWTQLSDGEKGSCALRARGGTVFCEEPQKWKPILAENIGETAVFRHGETEILREMLCAQRQLILCGGGHISVPVSVLGKLLGYQVTVLDDRPEFSEPSRFPAAEAVRCVDFARAIDALDRTQDLSFVIVTRGHQADLACLRAALRGAFSYVGMIGSKSKNRTVLETLRGEGLPEALLRQVHAPIGLAIGAQTPEEIAVSIAAELVRERSLTVQTALPQEVLAALLQNPAQGVMATVVRKSGSAPRGIGARMLFLEDGSQYGTVGGGAAEYAVCRMAAELLPEPRVYLHEFAMHPQSAADCGMICGGDIRVLFEPVEGLP